MNAALARNYGYVVASISLIGPSDEQTFQSRTAHDLQAPSGIWNLSMGPCAASRCASRCPSRFLSGTAEGPHSYQRREAIGNAFVDPALCCGGAGLLIRPNGNCNGRIGSALRPAVVGKLARRKSSGRISHSLPVRPFSHLEADAHIRRYFFTGSRRAAHTGQRLVSRTGG